MKRKTAKKLPLIVIILACCIFIVLFLPENCIFRFVKIHHSELQGFIQDNLQNLVDEKKDVTNEFLGCKIEYVANGIVPIVQFNYSAIGITTASSYYGFYYSPDDLPHAYWNYDTPLKKINSNEWSYRMDGDNHGITKRIRQNWYYYKVSF